MKKPLLIILVLVVFLIGAEPLDLVRFTVVNKSGYDLSIWLTGIAQEQFYYFAIPKGDRENPTIKVYTIAKDVYNMRVLYTKPWDPVYPLVLCMQHRPTRLVAYRQMRLVFIECDERPLFGTEPTMMKFWTLIYRFIDRKYKYIQ